MKGQEYRLITLLFFCVGIFLLQATQCQMRLNGADGEGQKAFAHANNLYDQKKYEEALQRYGLIDKKGSAALYNMGNCAFQLQKYVDAIVYWRRALKNCSYKNRADIEYNIAMAYKKFGYVSQKTFLSRLGESIYDFTSIFSLLWLQILFLFFWFMFFVSWLWLQRFRVFAFVFLLSLNLFIGAFLLVRYRYLQYSVAIVKDATTLFSGPDSNYHKVGDVRAADQVRIKEKFGEWYKAKNNGLVGWIKSEKVEII